MRTYLRKTSDWSYYPVIALAMALAGPAWTPTPLPYAHEGAASYTGLAAPSLPLTRSPAHLLTISPSHAITPSRRRVIAEQQRTEHFDHDPAWEGRNNRPDPAIARTVRQDFGYSGAHGGGAIGGFVTPAAEPAYYARKIPPRTLEDTLTASGTL